MLRICTGSTHNHYYKVGLMIAKEMSAHANVQVIATKGSWENLGRIYNKPRQCDAMIAQDDAYTVYLYEHPEKEGVIDRVTSLYSESLHLICHHQVAAKRLSELPQNTRILIGSYGSGTFITWDLVKRLNPQYSTLRALEVSGKEGLMRVADGEQAHCMLSVNALAQGLVAQANDDYGDRLKLLEISDRYFQRPINRGGVSKPLYQVNHIHKNIYPLLLKEHLQTQQIDAVFFVHHVWKTRYTKTYEHLINALSTLRRQIEHSVD